MDIDRQSLTANQQAAKQAGHGQGTTCFVMKIFFWDIKIEEIKNLSKDISISLLYEASSRPKQRRLTIFVSTLNKAENERYNKKEKYL